MKLASCVVSCGLLVSAGVAHAAGGISGAGGGGGSVSLYPSQTAGFFEVSGASDGTGVVGELLPYYVAAGAAVRHGPAGDDYEIAGQSDSAIFVGPDAPGGADQVVSRVSFTIRAAELLGVDGGVGAHGRGTALRFAGTLADDLYGALKLSGMAPARDYTVPGHADQVVGYGFYGKSLGCDKYSAAAKPICYLTFGDTGGQPL